MKAIYLFSLVFVLMSCGGNAENLKEGDKAPAFTLQDANGKTYTLSEFQGKSPVVVYFYPKAGTPGCTKEACGIRDDFKKFSENNIQVFGVSVDSKEEIKEFADEYSLNFPLLSDESKEVSKEYGVLNNFGVSSRVTFIIDKEGKIAKIMRDIDIDKHSSDVFQVAQNLK